MKTHDPALRRIRVLLSLQSALVGAITPRLRAVSVGWSEKSIRIYFFYDGPISEDDQEESECAVTEVLSDFPDDDLKAEHIRYDYPKALPDTDHTFVYERYERRA